MSTDELSPSTLDTDNWLDAHRDQRSSNNTTTATAATTTTTTELLLPSKSQTVLTVEQQPETTIERSESITSINMAGEIQNLSAMDNSDDVSSDIINNVNNNNDNSNNLASEKLDEQREEEEEKKEDEVEEIIAPPIIITEETSLLLQDAKEQPKEESESSGNNDQIESDDDAVDHQPSPENEEEQETTTSATINTPEANNAEPSENHPSEETNKEQAEEPSQEKVASTPPVMPPSASTPTTPPLEEEDLSSPSSPIVETVTSMDSLDLFATHTHSNAEVIEDTKLSETAVASSNNSNDDAPVVAGSEQEQTKQDTQQQKGKGDEPPPESRPSLAARAAAAATGILPTAVLSNISPRASPRTTPRSSPRPSPTRSQASTASSDTPSLAARAAAAAAAAAEATGIMPVLSTMSSGRASPITRQEEEEEQDNNNSAYPFSTSRTWPLAPPPVEEDTFFDNGQAVPEPVPSPPGSDVGVGGRLRIKPIQFPKLPSPPPPAVSPASSPPAAAVRVPSNAVMNAAATATGPVNLDHPRSLPPPAAASPLGGGRSESPTNSINVEIGGGGDIHNDNNNDEEAQVLSVIETTALRHDDFEDKDDELEELVHRELPHEESAHHQFKELDDDYEDEDGRPSSRYCDQCLAFSKTKKGIIVWAIVLLVVIAISVGVGVALSQPQESYCDAARKGYSIPNEHEYKQMDLNWIFDVSTTTKQLPRAFLKDVTQEFQAIVIPTIAGCEGPFLTVEDSRIINGYAVNTRDMGDCDALATRPCFRLLIDFAIWVREDYVNPFEMIGYLNDQFATFVTDQIETNGIVVGAQLVKLHEI